MSVKAFITDTKTGETREYDAGEVHEAIEFLWNEGNYSCDCNRAIFFDVAGGGDGNPEQQCGLERYIVKLVSDDGEIILDETESSEAQEIDRRGLDL